MSTNKISWGDTLKLTLASKTSGSPVNVGQITGVCISDTDTATGKVVIDRVGVYSLGAAGIDNSGASGADANVAVAIGDALYINMSDTPALSKRADGVLFGYALAVVASGNTTTTIDVAQKLG